MQQKPNRATQSVKNQQTSFVLKQSCSPPKSHKEHFISESLSPYHRQQLKAHAPRQNSFDNQSGDSLKYFQRKHQTSNFSLEKRGKNQSQNIHLKNSKFKNNIYKNSIQKKLRQHSFDIQGQDWYTPSKQKFSQSMQKKNCQFTKSLDRQQRVDNNFDYNMIKVYQPHNLFQSNTSKSSVEQVLTIFQKGKQLLKEQKIHEAIILLKQCIEIDKKFLESHYFLGIGYLGIQMYEKAIIEFKYVIQQDAIHRKNVYLLLAISLKKMNQLDQAIQILNKVLVLFPKYYDAYIYRGKLYTKLSEIDKAKQDFTVAIQLLPQNGLGYLGKADCLRLQSQYKEAMQCYQKALNAQQGVGNAAVLKNAIALYENQKYLECANNLTKLLEADPTNSQAHYFKGLCKLKMNNNTAALLCFEQAIKYNNSKKAITKSLYQIAKMKIQQKDFYAAYHTLNRSSMLDTESGYLENLRLITEAVIFLMKGKFEESMVNFEEIQKKYQLNDFLKPIFYAARAYGYFCLSEHQKALDDYQNLIDIQQSELNIDYNKLLCEGIIKVQSGLYDDGIELFKRAQKIFLKKMEPTFYMGVTYINQSFKTKNDQQKYVLQGLDLLDKANSINDQNINLYYVRSIVELCLGKLNDALMDIDFAIYQPGGGNAKYYYLRGMIFGILKEYEDSIVEFNNCLELDETFANAYLNRAKCHFLIGDSSSAFYDLQQYCKTFKDEQMIHLWAGNFLFANSAIEDAIQAYSNSQNFATDPKLLLLRSQCYMILGDLQLCYDDTNRLHQQTKSKTAEFDQNMLLALRLVFKDNQQIYFNEEIEILQNEFKNNLGKSINNLNKLSSENGKLFQQFHVYIFRGLFLFHLEKYEEALRNFQTAKSLKELQITEKKLQQRDIQQEIFNDEEYCEITEDEQNADSQELLEIKFNELICLVLLKQFTQAKEQCKSLIENINEEKQEGLKFLLMYIKRILIGDEQNIDYQGVICLYDEPLENIICFQLPIVFVKDLKIRLSFSLPRQSPPTLAMTFDKQLIQNIGPLSVENKPEAPWIRRELQNDMIILTENIQLVDNITLDSQKDKEQKQQNKYMLQINQIKKNLMLGKDLEEKIQRFLNKQN